MKKATKKAKAKVESKPKKMPRDLTWASIHPMPVDGKYAVLIGRVVVGWDLDKPMAKMRVERINAEINELMYLFALELHR